MLCSIRSVVWGISLGFVLLLAGANVALAEPALPPVEGTEQTSVYDRKSELRVWRSLRRRLFRELNEASVMTSQDIAERDPDIRRRVAAIVDKVAARCSAGRGVQYCTWLVALWTHPYYDPAFGGRRAYRFPARAFRYPPHRVQDPYAEEPPNPDHRLIPLDIEAAVAMLTYLNEQPSARSPRSHAWLIAMGFDGPPDLERALALSDPAQLPPVGPRDPPLVRWDPLVLRLARDNVKHELVRLVTSDSPEDAQRFHDEIVPWFTAYGLTPPALEVPAPAVWWEQALVAWQQEGAHHVAQGRWIAAARAMRATALGERGALDHPAYHQLYEACQQLSAALAEAPRDDLSDAPPLALVGAQRLKSLRGDFRCEPAPPAPKKSNTPVPSSHLLDGSRVRLVSRDPSCKEWVSQPGARFIPASQQVEVRIAGCRLERRPIIDKRRRLVSTSGGGGGTSGGGSTTPATQAPSYYWVNEHNCPTNHIGPCGRWVPRGGVVAGAGSGGSGGSRMATVDTVVGHTYHLVVEGPFEVSTGSTPLSFSQTIEVKMPSSRDVYNKPDPGLAASQLRYHLASVVQHRLSTRQREQAAASSPAQPETPAEKSAHHLEQAAVARADHRYYEALAWMALALSLHPDLSPEDDAFLLEHEGVTGAEVYQMIHARR